MQPLEFEVRHDPQGEGYRVEIHQQGSGECFTFTGFDSAGVVVPESIRDKTNLILAKEAMDELATYTKWLFGLYGPHTQDDETSGNPGPDGPNEPPEGPHSDLPRSDPSANAADPGEQEDTREMAQTFDLASMLASLDSATLEEIDHLGTTRLDDGSQVEQVEGDTDGKTQGKKILPWRPRRQDADQDA